MSAPEVIIERGDGTFWGLDIVESASFTPDIIVATKPIDPGSSGGATIVIDSTVETGLGISIRGVMTAYPIAGPGTLTAHDRERATVDFLRSIVGELVTVVLPRYPAFTNCLLNAYPHQLSGNLETPFTLGFRKNQIARSQTVILSNAPTGQGTAPEARGAVPEEDIGEQTTKPVSDPVQVQDESSAVTLGKALGILD